MAEWKTVALLCAAGAVVCWSQNHGLLGCVCGGVALYLALAHNRPEDPA